LLIFSHARWHQQEESGTCSTKRLSINSIRRSRLVPVLLGIARKNARHVLSIVFVCPKKQPVDVIQKPFLSQPLSRQKPILQI
jgi:hypothetical protein